MSITVGSRTFSTPDELENLITHAATEYDLNGYAEDFDGVEITDPEYDVLLNKLKEVKPDSEAFEGTSPSKATVAGDIVVHDPPMTSIEKADGSLEEKEAKYNSWLKSCADLLGIPVSELEVVQSFKHDGVAIRVNYIKGKLISAGLRPRDGINGSDVTRHAPNIEGIPKKLNLPLTLSLNGEIECWMSAFEEVNAARDAAGEEQYKNPRNYTAGCMGRDDAKETKNAGLRVAFYSITGFEEWASYYATEVERAKWANSEEGLNLQKDGKGYFVQVRKHRHEDLQKMEDHAPKLPYYVDGAVLKINNLEYQEQLGHHGDNPVNAPRGAVAWKFKEETAEAVVSSIEWNASRTGRIVPTAIFDEPFVLADTENTRATCNNYGWMESKGLGPGAKVLCKKGGKIIPNIMEVLESVKSVGEPDHCPTCNTDLVLEISDTDNKDLRCKNPNCAAKQMKSWIFFLQKIGGKGLGLSSMKKILHTGKVKCLADLFALTEEDLLENDVFTERQAILAIATIWLVKANDDSDKLRANIAKARSEKIKIEGWKFFGSLGIPGAGDTAGKALIAHFGNFNDITKATVDDLVVIDGIGEKTAQAIIDWFSHYIPSGDLGKLLDYFELILPKKGKLTGKNFVLTGSFTNGKKHWQTLIEDQGGNMQSSVGRNTSYLVQENGKTDGTPSAKEKKADQLNIPIISIPELEKLL